MTVLSQLYQRYQNTTIFSFDGNAANDGQCVQWALMVRTRRDDLPARFGNAVDWWNNRGTDIRYYDYIPYVIGTYPKAGDYVVWGSGVGSAAGHIDVCTTDGDASGFTGYDSNWQDKPVLTTIRHNYLFGILGYIRVKEITMNPDETRVQVLCMQFFGRPASKEDLAHYEGMSYLDAINDMNGRPEHVNYFNRVSAALQGPNDAVNKLTQIKEIVNS